jgi:hypothetical protein
MEQQFDTGQVEVKRRNEEDSRYLAIKKGSLFCFVCHVEISQNHGAVLPSSSYTEMVW